MRLRAKTETSVARLISQTARKLPRTAPPATLNGRPAERTLPKTSSSSTSVTGTAIDSARARSSVIVSFRAFPTAAPPPTCTTSPSRVPP
jgi:hypothetical protein